MHIAKFMITHDVRMFQRVRRLLTAQASTKTPLSTWGDLLLDLKDDTYCVLQNGTRCVLSGVIFILDAPSAEVLQATLDSLKLPKEIQVRLL